ncbi:hypothetical protein [Nitrosopumilus sp.]|uniref:hypothetical protein n=1 Tax=Nitrosopumilus sp. TaxID=2024843 RepID=UPI002930C333|nr:hypothetical protein [Nitrosopumilus sp.]
MKNYLAIILILLIGIISIDVTASLAVSDDDEWILSIMKSPTEKENDLIEQGYHPQEYPINPFGTKHFFYKSDVYNQPGSEMTFNRCMIFATYPLDEGESVNVSIKFPNDLTWPGGYDNSTVLLGKGGYYSHVDSAGNATVQDTETVWEKYEPLVDSDFTTIEFEFRDEISHLVINMTSLPEPNTRDNFLRICPHIIPEMRYDYYDKVHPVETQRMFAEMLEFPPDTFICEGNLIGAIKINDDEKSVCVKPNTKIKLIERGWAQEF